MLLQSAILLVVIMTMLQPLPTGVVAIGSGSVDAAQMLLQILQAREALPVVALAVRMRAVEGLLGPAVLAVDLALVAQQPAAVGEALDLLAAFNGADVGAFVFVHVFAREDG